MSEGGNLERESRLIRMKDNLIALQQRYGELLKLGRLGTSVEQQMNELQSSVLSASMVRLCHKLRTRPCAPSPAAYLA